MISVIKLMKIKISMNMSYKGLQIPVYFYVETTIKYDDLVLVKLSGDC